MRGMDGKSRSGNQRYLSFIIDGIIQHKSLPCQGLSN